MSQEIIERIEGQLGTIGSSFTAHDEAIKELLEKNASQEATIAALAKRLDAMPDPSRIAKPGANWDDDTKTRFAKWMVNAIRGEKAALLGQTDSLGGYTIPDEFVPEIIRLAGEAAVLWPRCTRWPMKGDTLMMPADAGGMTIAWASEGGAPTETEPTFGQVKLEAKKAFGFAKASDELLADSPINLADYLVTLYTEALATECDKQILAGDGTTFTGVLYASDVNEVVMTDPTFASISVNDLSLMISKVKRQAKKGAAFAMDKSVVHFVRMLKDDAGRFIYSPASSPDVPGNIWGFPVLEVEGAPVYPTDDGSSKPFVAFGNFAHYFHGDKGQLEVLPSQHVYYLTGYTAFRFQWRGGFKIAIPSAFARLVTGA